MPASASLLARIDYAPLPGRPRLRWPNDARLAFWVIPNVEYYQYTPPAVRVGRSGFPAPDVPAYASRDYGNRVGFWRMLHVLDRHEIRCTVNINLAVLEHFLEIRDAMLARDWDFCFHGFYDDLPEPRGLSEAEERAWYERAIRMFHDHTGRRMSGANVLSRGSHHVPDLLSELGFLYQGRVPDLLQRNVLLRRVHVDLTDAAQPLAEGASVRYPLIPNMVAKVVTNSTKPKEAIVWAEREIKRMFEKK